MKSREISIQAIYRATAQTIDILLLQGHAPLSLLRVTRGVCQLLAIDDSDRFVTNALVAGYAGLRPQMNTGLVQALEKEPERLAKHFERLADSYSRSATAGQVFPSSDIADSTWVVSRSPQTSSLSPFKALVATTWSLLLRVFRLVGLTQLFSLIRRKQEK